MTRDIDIDKLWQNALNQEADETFIIDGHFISAFCQELDKFVIWIVMCDFGDGFVSSALLPDNEYKFFKAMNGEISFMDF